SERGTSHQALLALGALPESVAFPGSAAELLFAPLEAVGFPVDACLSAQFVPNDHATALVARKVVDADNIVDEEARGNHGPSTDASSASTSPPRRHACATTPTTCWSSRSAR